MYQLKAKRKSQTPFLMNEIKKVKKNNKKLYAKKKKIDPSVIIKKKEKEREGGGGRKRNEKKMWIRLVKRKVEVPWTYFEKLLSIFDWSPLLFIPFSIYLTLQVGVRIGQAVDTGLSHGLFNKKDRLGLFKKYI